MRFEQNKNGYHEFETPQFQPQSGQLGSIEQAQNKLSPEPAEYLLSIVFAEGDREGMTLAVRSESGVLTADERQEFDSYLHVGNLLAVINRKPGSPCVGNRTASIEARPAFLPY